MRFKAEADVLKSSDTKFGLMLKTWLAFALLVVSASVWNARPASAANIFVNSLGDEPDLAINGNCLTAVGTCTLRAAIQEANAIGGGDSITVGVTGTITLTSSLPAITGDGVEITGPGATQL